MTSGCLILLPIIDHDIMRLDRITLLPYCPLAGKHFPPTVRMQVFRVLFMVPADPAIEQLFAGLLFAVPAVYVLRIIEFLKTTIVTAFLLFVDRRRPVLWLETAHDISVIDM